MFIKCAMMKNLEDVEYITWETIKRVYPHYYPQGAIEFFLSHHNKDNISKDIQDEKTFMLYHDDHVPVGSVTIHEHEICRLFVLPSYQKRGYGQMLLDFAETIISERFDTIRLDTSLPAKKIYLKRGYMEVETHSIKTHNGDYLCYDILEKHVVSASFKINYNGKCFISKENTENGEVGKQTVFYYHQKGPIIWGEYAGGDIIKGTITGTSDEAGNLTFAYQHLNKHNEIRIGECYSEPLLLEGRKLELHEKWKWLNGDKSQGSSIIIEK